MLKLNKNTAVFISFFLSTHIYIYIYLYLFLHFTLKNANKMTNLNVTCCWFMEGLFAICKDEMSIHEI